MTAPDDWSEVLATVACLDVTSLTGTETDEDIVALCELAVRPLPGREARCAAVCVYPGSVAAAVAALGDSPVPVAAAAFGPDPGRGSPAQRIDDIDRALEAGAREIDVVVTVEHILGERWNALHDEVAGFRDAAGDVPLKVILEAGAVSNRSGLRRASDVAISAGADFLKTSTGKAAAASLEGGAVMLEAIRTHRKRTGDPIGFKPAGGIRTVERALEWRSLVSRILGRDALDPTRFRIGASGLLHLLRDRIEHWNNRDARGGNAT